MKMTSSRRKHQHGDLTVTQPLIGEAVETVENVSMVSSGNALMIILNEAVLTPHIAELTQDVAECMAISSVQNVLDISGCRLDQNLVVKRSFG